MPPGRFLFETFHCPALEWRHRFKTRFAGLQYYPTKVDITSQMSAAIEQEIHSMPGMDESDSKYCYRSTITSLESLVPALARAVREQHADSHPQ